MKKAFLTEDFLLETETALELYHQHAENMPIYDYHSHLPVADIAEDKIFQSLTQIWLYGDHYKWRAMRANGVDERYCTGDAADEEKFQKWTETVPYTIRNPLYHWIHLELKRYFGIEKKLLSAETAKEIYQSCSEMLRTPQYSTRNLLRKMKVKVLCTTDDPIDDLRHHKKIREDEFKIRILPTFRPDKAMTAEDPSAYNSYIDKLSEAAGVDINSYGTLVEAVKKRHDYFHQMGCRLSDHGLETAYTEEFTESEVSAIFDKVRGGQSIDNSELLKLKSALMLEFGRMNNRKGWVQQFHLGALRNTNTRLFRVAGPDAGFDSMGDFEIARPLAGYMDRLDEHNELTKTIIYNLNPRDNELIATMAGNFQDGSFPGKIQYGPGWWFLDQKDGMEKQLNALSNMGLLSRFVGMVTDSRSFLSFPRHEYFRRILCNLLGRDVENGEIPYDMDLLGGIVENICFNNARHYFDIQL